MWRVFDESISTLHTPYALTDDVINNFEKSVIGFLSDWETAGVETGMHGYGSITPYMHCMARHLPEQLRRIRSGLIMSCQGMPIFCITIMNINLEHKVRISVTK